MKKCYSLIEAECQRCHNIVSIPSIVRGRFKYCKECRKIIDRQRHYGPQPSKEREKEERRVARARDGIGGEFHISKDPDESWGKYSSFTLNDIEEMLETDYLTPGTEFAKEPAATSTHRVVQCGDKCELKEIAPPFQTNEVKTMSYSCLNQKHQEELIAIRDGMNVLQWRVGDIANEEYAAQKEAYSFAYICAAVGYYVGKSGSTIQRWARVAAFYPPEWRSKYDGLLSFEHYATAACCPNWQELLEKAATGGSLETPQSVDQMLSQTLPPHPPEPDTFPEPPTAVVSYEADVPQVQIVGRPESAFQAILSMIGKLADMLGLDDERRAKVYRAMELLTEALGASVESR